MKKLLLTTLLISLIILSSLQAQGKIVLKAGSPFPKGHIITEAMENFKAMIEERTNGRITVELEIQKDTEEGVNDKCAKGLLDMQFTGGRPVEVFAPAYFFVNAPFVMKDYEHFFRVWNGPIGAKAKKELEQKGNMIALGTLYRGYRQTTSNRLILNARGFVGLKLRLPVVPTWVKIWEAVGVKPVQATLAELYQVLKDGRAEASEGDLTQISGYKLYEVQKYLIITNHLASFGWVTIYKPTFEKLSPEDQKLVSELVEKVCNDATNKLLTNENAILKQLIDKGMTVIYLPTKVMDEIRKKAKPAIEELFRTTWPVTTWDEVLSQ